MEIHNLAGHLIRRLNQISTSVFQTRLKDEGFDLTPVQYAAMTAIHTHPGMDQATVAAFISYDRATIGGVIDRLHGKGLVSREINEKDRRARVLSLTDQGRVMIEQITPVIQTLQNDILSGLSVEERETFLALATKAAAAGSNLPTMPTVKKRRLG